MSTPLRPLNCPNCAAPLPPGSLSTCPYCGTTFQQPVAPPQPTATDRIAAELAIVRLTPEILQLRAEIDKIEAAHSKQLGCGCLGLCAAIFGLTLLYAAFSDRGVSPWSGYLGLAIGSWYARNGYLASKSNPAARSKQRLALLQAELDHARRIVSAHQLTMPA